MAAAATGRPQSRDSTGSLARAGCERFDLRLRRDQRGLGRVGAPAQLRDVVAERLDVETLQLRVDRRDVAMR
jgi:hypothetical protein